MNEFSVITIMNEATINVLKSKKVDCSINLKIKEYLKDEALFFRVSPQRAYEILSAVGVKKEQLENTYKKFFRERCQTCGSRLICNGCSNCGQCAKENPSAF